MFSHRESWKALLQRKLAELIAYEFLHLYEQSNMERRTEALASAVHKWSFIVMHLRGRPVRSSALYFHQPSV